MWLCQEELRATLAALAQQQRCNDAVDGVVAAEATAPLAARDEEMAQLADAAVASLERSSAHAHEVGLLFLTYGRTSLLEDLLRTHGVSIFFCLF